MTAPAEASPLAIRTRALRKTYPRLGGKRTVAVTGLDLDVPAGGVHGFLGPNGSGKTTTIRMLLGLIRADSGTMEIFGQPVPQRLPDVIGQVGAIVEQPKFYPYFSARENLTLLAKAIGTPAAQVDAVLEQVQLSERAKDKYRTYSLGMKQRLAVAGTLLKDPSLLIFDEPTNGLDPAGIREIRETMRSLGNDGKTVLVSSHILAEVEQVADTVSIIGRGTMLAHGRVDELIKTKGTGLIDVGVRPDDRAQAITTLLAAGITVHDGGDLLEVSGVPDPALITYTLAETGIYVTDLVRRHAGLEQFFLELTAGESPGGQEAPGHGTPGVSATNASKGGK